MRLVILLVTMLWAADARAAVERSPIASNVQLEPGESRTITVKSTEPMEIGWQAVQANACAGNCVQATDVTGGINQTIATRLGASMKYTPASGKIPVKYKNVSKRYVDTQTPKEP